MLKDLLSFAVGNVALDKNRIRAEIERLVEGGFLQKKEAAEILQAVTAAAEQVTERSHQKLSSVTEALGRSVRGLLDLPSRAEVEALQARLDALEGGAASGSPAPASSAPAPAAGAPAEAGDEAKKDAAAQGEA